jgi:hypothetical protein
MRTITRLRTVLVAITLTAATCVMSGCHGAIFGAGWGALAGQAIGGNTESTLAGAFWGALFGAAADASHHGHACSSCAYAEGYVGYSVGSGCAGYDY